MNLMHRKTPSGGFTLIELLVVVGVIAILAAIALPNFLEAQVRARTSRVVADLKTMQTAAEAYAVDNNRVPRMSWGRPPYNDRYTGYSRNNEPIYGTFGPWVTSPIAYITSYDFLDPFTRSKDDIRFDAILYTYHDLPTARHLTENFGDYGLDRVDVFEEDFGMYFLLSLGPDGATGFGNEFYMQYDPTNGTVSPGNIVRSQRTFESYLPKSTQLP